MNPPLTRKSAPSGLLDTSIWPTISTEGLADKLSNTIGQWHNVISAYTRGTPVASLLEEYGYSHRELLRKFNKCIQVADDGRLAGWRGILPNAMRKPYVRQTEVTGSGNGAGALHQLFKRFDGLEKYLQALVTKTPIPGHIHEPRISNKALHAAFLEKCSELGVEATQWPFNARWKGRRTIDSFVANTIATHGPRAVATRYGELVASKMCTGTGKDRILLAMAPLDVAEMDAHRIDLIGVIGLPTPEGVAWIPIERLMILLICDGREGTVLGYYVVVRRECSSDDILAAAMPLVKPWKQRELVKGMEYAAGSGLPLGAIDGFCPYGFCALLVDNALINYSWAVTDRLVRRIGCAVNWGPVRKWMRRPLVERIFGALEQAGFQRVVSSTGSHPKDSRRSDPVAAAVKHRVHLNLVLDLIDLVIAGYNAKSSEGRFGMSPLDTMRDLIDPRNGRTLFPVLPPVTPLAPELDTHVFYAHIRGSSATGRRPRIKFQRANYTNPTIAQNPKLSGEEVLLHVRPDDIRTIDVFAKSSGASLGTATAQGKWRHHAHSLEMRRQINRYIDDGRLVLDGSTDPVTAMHQVLHKEATQRKKKGSRQTVSKAATQLAREAQVTGVAAGSLAKKNPHAPPDHSVVSRRAPPLVHRVGGNRRV